MNQRDKNSVIALIVLLLLLIVVSAVLLIMAYNPEDSAKDYGQDDYDQEYVLNSYYTEPNTGNEYDRINYYNNTYRGSGSGGGGGGSSRNECTEEQVIMRLYGSENTHGALWNETAYTLKVCYNEIFGEMFDTNGQDPHQCSGNAGSEENAVLRLIKSFNSHAEAPEAFSGNYTLPVCYGDLSCVSRTECTGSEKEIVSLTGERNAHLESRDADNYPLKVCCTSSGSF